MPRAAALLAALVLGIAPGGVARAQTPVAATTNVDRDTITIGDPIKVSVVVEFEDGYRVGTLPRLAKLGDLDVLDALPLLEGHPSAGLTRWTFRYFVTSFRLGDFAVPGFDIDYTGPDGVGGNVVTAPVAIRVRSVVQPGEAATDIKPLKPQLELPGSLASRFAYWGAVLAAGVAVAAPIVLLVRLARRRRATAVVADPARTPAQETLRELQRIASLQLPGKGRHDEHYELLARAMRRYLAAQFAIPAEHRTARELYRDMERAGIERRQAVAINEILREGEAVRFQRAARHPRHAQEALAAALAALAKAAAAERPEIEVAT